MDYPKYSRNVESCLSYLDLSKANQLKANSKYMQKFWGFQSELFPFSLRLSDVMVVPILIWEDAALAFFSIHHYHHCLLVFLPRHTIDTLW